MVEKVPYDDFLHLFGTVEYLAWMLLLVRPSADTAGEVVGGAKGL
jgi:hypothetical protein